MVCVLYFNVGFYLNEEGSEDERLEKKGLSVCFWNLCEQGAHASLLILLMWLLHRSFVL